MKQSIVILVLSLIIAACPVQFLYAHSGGGGKDGGEGAMQTEEIPGVDLDSPPDQYQPTTEPIKVWEQEGGKFQETTRPARPPWSSEYTDLSQNDQKTLTSAFQDLYDGRTQLQHQQAPVKYQTVAVQEGNTFVSSTVAVPQKHPGLIKIERAIYLLASNPQILDAFMAENSRRQSIDEMDRRDAQRQLSANYQRMQADEDAARVLLIKYGGRILIGNNLLPGLLYSLTWTAAQNSHLDKREFNSKMDRTVAWEIGKKVAIATLPLLK